jgi:hypothetical protein
MTFRCWKKSAIVNDLASLYGGHLFDESPDHGLRARLDLPAVVG